MKSVTIETYKFPELCQEAQERAIEKYRESGVVYEISWVDEIIDSMKAAFEAISDVTLSDYSIDPERESWVKFHFYNDETADFTGKRAFAWLENNLIGKLRIPFTGKARWNVAKYGEDYRPGMVKPCPLTGFCFDDEIIADIYKTLREGYSVGDALNGIAELTANAIEREYEYQYSEECISETLTGNEYDFTIDGEMF